MQRCGLCRYKEGTEEYLFCRRYPPSITNDGDALYPHISEDDWCGEYKSAKAATKAAGFTPPTIREIHDYCAEIDSSVSPVEFFNHYEAVKWMKGRSKMADWKAAIRGWTAREGK